MLLFFSTSNVGLCFVLSLYVLGTPARWLKEQPSQQLHTNGIFSVVCCLLFMVALQIPVAQSVKSRSIKRPSVRGVQTLIAFLCSRSLCPGTTVPLCHNSAPKIIKCSTLYPGIKGVEDSFCCKRVPRSMA